MDIEIRRTVTMTAPSGSSVTATYRQPSHRAASVAMMHVSTLSAGTGGPTPEQVSQLYAWAEDVCARYVDDMAGITVAGARLPDAPDAAEWWSYVPPGLTLALAQHVCTPHVPGVALPFDPWATSRG